MKNKDHWNLLSHGAFSRGTIIMSMVSIWHVHLGNIIPWAIIWQPFHTKKVTGMMQRSCDHKLSSHARRASLWYCLNNHTAAFAGFTLPAQREQHMHLSCMKNYYNYAQRTVSVKKGWAQLQRRVWSWKGGTLNCAIVFCIWTQKYTALHCMHGRDEEIWTSGSWNNPIILALESTGASFLDVLLLRLQFWPSTMVFPSLFFCLVSFDQQLLQLETIVPCAKSLSPHLLRSCFPM
jgi:hypothetical protein